MSPTIGGVKQTSHFCRNDNSVATTDNNNNNKAVHPRLPCGRRQHKTLHGVFINVRLYYVDIVGLGCDARRFDVLYSLIDRYDLIEAVLQIHRVRKANPGDRSRLRGRTWTGARSGHALVVE